MKVTTILVAALFVLQMPCTELSHSAGQGGTKFQDEISQQEKIYKSDDESMLAVYVVARSLRNYAHALPRDFDRALADLGPEDRWLDIGAGMGFAILDGSEVRICSWLKSITCVKVTCEFRKWNPSGETYRIRKFCNDVTVPNLKLTLYKAGMPPARQFQLGK